MCGLCCSCSNDITACDDNVSTLSDEVSTHSVVSQPVAITFLLTIGFVGKQLYLWLLVIVILMREM